ncbi:Methylamine utilization protein MauE [Actinacidiphila cocklensis]|uniref:Methylamine utilization protein MauE n=2 Tax=Actinacidiphila cocklensis TaxID=887465 RepID=A0A9W4DTE0_9ACTN|nr:Methylamine utilization protein MauE [Actinacidiphila cocklensis]
MDRVFSMACSLLASVVGGTLLVAGVPKLRDREGLLRVVRAYQVLPAGAERVVALLLPYAEIAVGALLVLGVAVRPAAALGGLLFLGFCAGLTVNLLRGRRELDCGCFAFGVKDAVPHIGWFHALRALALALVAGLTVATYRGPGLAGHAVAVALAALLLAMVTAAAQVRQVVHPGRRPVDTHLSRAAGALRQAPAGPSRR